jgi:putative peptidoglycan lipid II flippase
LGIPFLGVAQIIAHLIVAKKKKILKFLCIGYKKKIKVDTTEFNKHFLPSVFGNSTAHISAFLDTWLATFLIAGSISYLYYANRLFQLPFALFVIATSTVFFPKITKLLHSNKEKEAIEMMKKTFWILFYLLILATIIGIMDSKEIVKVLFEHGAFTDNDTKITANVLIMYLIGLIPYGLSKLFSSFLYATHKHLKAAKFSAIALGGNIIFSIILIFPLKVYGLALSSSIAGIIMLYLYIKEFSFKLFFNFFEKKYIFYLILCIIASIIAAIIFKKILLLI